MINQLQKNCAYLNAYKPSQGTYALGKTIAGVEVLNKRPDCQKMCIV